MLPILVIGWVIFSRWAAIEDAVRRVRIARFALAAVVLQVAAFAALSVDVEAMPELFGTTGSDSLEYYLAATRVLAGTQTVAQALDDFAGGYGVFCYAVIATWFGPSPVPLVIANILLFVLVVLDLDEVMFRSGFGPRAAWWATLLIVANGALVWTAIRVLKDVLFYALFLEALLAATALPSRRWTNLAVLAGSCVWMAFVRPQSWILVLAVAALARALAPARAAESEGAPPRAQEREEADGLRGVRRRRVLATVAVVAGVGAVGYAWFREAIDELVVSYVQSAGLQALQDAESWGARSMDLFQQDPLTQIAVGIPRFFLLPIPISTLIAPADFDVYRVLGFTGASLALLSLGYSARALLRPVTMVREGQGLIVALAVMALGMSVTYIALFSGNAEARHRLPFLVTFALVAGRRVAEGRIGRAEHAVVLGAYVLLNVAYLVIA